MVFIEYMMDMDTYMKNQFMLMVKKMVFVKYILEMDNYIQR